MQGIVPIAVMPFNKEGVVDQEELSREITFLLEIGIEWVGFGFEVKYILCLRQS